VIFFGATVLQVKIGVWLMENNQSGWALFNPGKITGARAAMRTLKKTKSDIPLAQQCHR